MFIQFFSIVFVWQCYPKLTTSLALPFLKWEPERLLAVHVLDYFYFKASILQSLIYDNSDINYNRTALLA